MNPTPILAAAAAAVLLASPAAAAGPSNRPDCFWTSQALKFAPMGRGAVNLRLTSGAVYQLQLAGDCPNIDWRREIGLVAPASERVCVGRPAEVVTRTEVGPLRCAVQHIRRLTPAEVAALPQDARPR